MKKGLPASAESRSPISLRLLCAASVPLWFSLLHYSRRSFTTEDTEATEGAQSGKAGSNATKVSVIHLRREIPSRSLLGQLTRWRGVRSTMTQGWMAAHDPKAPSFPSLCPLCALCILCGESGRIVQNPEGKENGSARLGGVAQPQLLSSSLCPLCVLCVLCGE